MLTLLLAAQALLLTPQHSRRPGLPAWPRASTPRLDVSPSEYQQKQDDLESAVAAEDYAAAAALRDELANMTVDDQMAIMSVNAEFYAAFTSGDFERMCAVWDDDQCTCIHPGQAPLHGREEVMDSWKGILGTARMEIQAEKVRCMLIGSSAVVTCYEVVEGASALVATNVFAKSVAGRWRMVLHQAGQVMRTEPLETEI